MCHDYRIADREALGATEEEREEERTPEFDPVELATEREETEEGPPLPTADD